MDSPNNLTRREFLSSAAAFAATFSIVPSNVISGTGHIPPSESSTDTFPDRPLPPVNAPGELGARLLATVLRESNDAITTLSMDGRILSWNRKAELVYGYAESDAAVSPSASPARRTAGATISAAKKP